MRKIIALLLIIVLLCGSALAVSESDYIGVWVIYRNGKDYDDGVQVFILKENHILLYFNQQCFGDEASLWERNYLGEWYLDGYGKVHMKTSETHTDVGRLVGSNCMLLDSEFGIKIYLGRVAEYWR